MLGRSCFYIHFTNLYKTKMPLIFIFYLLIWVDLRGFSWF
ncbi:MAG: hypothetical protein JWM43_2547 [Acidobacteriaceae bacterium]|nr:hypothetical protein [Acidobacteriaceae bacterium]